MSVLARLQLKILNDKRVLVVLDDVDDKNSSGAFLKLSQQIVSLTGGITLGSEVFGSFLLIKRRVENGRRST
ncbi:TMV resistance protein N-like protein [Cinnamomum micranthum f. kanehirae]|uniref:TMV resistance protein N-like protein n=1 Tax=Cinnamomum micranthum f. kanehirae TaxID=337451 RepID=A0A3S3N5B5_9MAGN|nr:TMV resistance protein N-like protein [Cinnamomum micranthum f. kanehirae]